MACVRFVRLDVGHRDVSMVLLLAVPLYERLVLPACAGEEISGCFPSLNLYDS